MVLTNPKDSGALVTVSQVSDKESISIFLDPNCPDFSQHFVRWEGLQSSLLRVLTNHNTEDWKGWGMFQKLGDELKVLTDHAHDLRLEASSLKREQGALDQRMDRLQSEQNQAIQVEPADVKGWETQPGLIKIITGVFTCAGAE